MVQCPRFLSLPMAPRLLLVVLVNMPTVLLAAEHNMASAAGKFLDSLSATDRELARFAINADERLNWHFVPVEMFPRKGLPLRAMNPEQQESARALLQTGLSQRGYLTATAIMELEKVLNELETNSRFNRDHENYRVSVFGEPDAAATWAWRFEGHHLSLHFQIIDGAISVSTPSFFGSNPAHVTRGAQTESQRGQRVLGDREDAGRALVASLDKEQLDLALLDGAVPRDIITGADYPIDPLASIGIPADRLSQSQLMLLRQLITVYSSAMTESVSALRWEKIDQDGLDSVRFVWAGSLETGEPHYYRIQGPSFLIEYDNVQNGANHVHSVWRDFEGDFGEDLLREHYLEHSH